MKSARAPLIVVAVLASSTAAWPQMPPGPTALGGPDSFGLGDQILHVPAAAFQSNPNTGVTSEYEFGADGYLRNTIDDYVLGYFAPLVLPPGAQIWAICTYFYAPDGNSFVTTSLQVVKLADATTAPEKFNVYGPFHLDFHNGYNVACSNSSYTYRNTGDQDHDGATEQVVHQLHVAIQDDGALGGVRVFWRHQVGNPVTNALFSDVPSNDPDFEFVQAFGLSGITSGCAGGRYCPSAPLTRRQLAVFLSRALGLHWN